MLLQDWEVSAIKWVENSGRNGLIVSVVQTGEGYLVHNKRKLFPTPDTRTTGKLIIMQTMEFSYHVRSLQQGRVQGVALI